MVIAQHGKGYAEALSTEELQKRLDPRRWEKHVQIRRRAGPVRCHRGAMEGATQDRCAVLPSLLKLYSPLVVKPLQPLARSRSGSFLGSVLRKVDDNSARAGGR